EPLCPYGSTPVQAEYVAGDGMIKTAAGILQKDNEVFVTAGKKGALTFGPWLTLPVGRYSVAWYGNVMAESRPTFDVSSRGELLKSGSPDLKPSSNEVELFAQRFELSAPA